MANEKYDLDLQGGDAITVTFTDGTSLAGDFIRWYPSADGVALSFWVPQGAAAIGDITSVYFVDNFRHIQKLTPTAP
jgi:hypothetical protein